MTGKAETGIRRITALPAWVNDCVNPWVNDHVNFVDVLPLGHQLTVQRLCHPHEGCNV